MLRHQSWRSAKCWISKAPLNRLYSSTAHADDLCIGRQRVCVSEGDIGSIPSKHTACYSKLTLEYCCKSSHHNLETGLATSAPDKWLPICSVSDVAKRFWTRCSSPGCSEFYSNFEKLLTVMPATLTTLTFAACQQGKSNFSYHFAKGYGGDKRYGYWIMEVFCVHLIGLAFSKWE